MRLLLVEDDRGAAGFLRSGLEAEHYQLEIATDGPGFSVDENPDALGSGLQLPPWLEGRREAIEGQLAPLG